MAGIIALCLLAVVMVGFPILLIGVMVSEPTPSPKKIGIETGDEQ